jgi:NlpC/P60 family/Bacterial dipeptidyl-peptidase Sh3 domain
MTVSPRTKFLLHGTSIPLDERVHAVRGDLADLALAGQLFVPHYAKPMPMTCAVPNVAVMATARDDAKQISELLLGEDFMVVDMAGEWAWGFCRHDHYVGYVPLTALSNATDATVSVVCVREANVYAEPDSVAAITLTLPMGAKITGNPHGDFVETALGFVAIGALDQPFSDAASVAEALLGVPYHWGGRSGHGIDCSGLIQMSLALSTGLAAPRDSDQQQESLGTVLPDGAPLQRGDIIFFPGHVGIMADSATLVHATMHYGKTVTEPLAETIARIGVDHPTPVLARKRMV